MKPSNVDQREIARFEALSSLWWDRNGALKALHDINGLRVSYIDSRAPLSGKKVLDIGCGGGILSEAMAALGGRVTAIDAGEAPLMVAKLHLKESGLKVDYRLSTAEEFAKENPEPFDVVTCLELLEHVPEPDSVVQACSRLLAPGGDVFFATLNRNLKSFLFAIVGAEYLLRLVRRGTHQYRRFIKPSELKAWAEAGRCTFQDLTGLNYNPFRKTYRLGGSTDVNYFMHFRKQT
jgi:2-polyprenyl-6-hydroxyphenyl methylase / 3-demethylubiquinone-9 3-methyltransferase